MMGSKQPLDVARPVRFNPSGYARLGTTDDLSNLFGCVFAHESEPNGLQLAPARRIGLPSKCIPHLLVRSRPRNL
jgi:hypothetical protein